MQVQWHFINSRKLETAMHIVIEFVHDVMKTSHCKRWSFSKGVHYIIRGDAKHVAQSSRDRNTSNYNRANDVAGWQPTPTTAHVTVTKIAGYVRVRIIVNR